jgi:hypothetical protein
MRMLEEAERVAWECGKGLALDFGWQRDNGVDLDYGDCGEYSF